MSRKDTTFTNRLEEIMLQESEKFKEELTDTMEDIRPIGSARV